MLTTYRIREHFESLEVERLRAEVKELQTRLCQLQSELMQYRREAHPSEATRPAKSPEE